jgi:hypothetical protein
MRLLNWRASPRLPIMANLLSQSRAGSGQCRHDPRTVQFCPRLQYNHKPPFVYLQRIDDNMSSDLEWHLLRVRETIFNTLLQLTLL